MATAMNSLSIRPHGLSFGQNAERLYASASSPIEGSHSVSGSRKIKGKYCLPLKFSVVVLFSIFPLALCRQVDAMKFYCRSTSYEAQASAKRAICHGRMQRKKWTAIVPSRVRRGRRLIGEEFLQSRSQLPMPSFKIIDRRRDRKWCIRSTRFAGKRD